MQKNGVCVLPLQRALGDCFVSGTANASERPERFGTLRFYVSCLISSCLLALGFIAPKTASAQYGYPGGYPYGPPTLSWVGKSAMPTQFVPDKVVVATDGKVYVVGGGYINHATNTASSHLPYVYAYDPATDTWTVKASLPTDRSDYAVAAGPNGKIYVLGGQIINQTRHLDLVEVYDTVSNSWSTGPTMPVGRFRPSAIAGLDGKLYIFGGTTVASDWDRHYEYAVDVLDPSTNTWSSGTPASTFNAKADSAIACASDGTIYLHGNEVGQAATILRCYSPSTGIWTSKSSSPNPSASGSACFGQIGLLYSRTELYGGYGVSRLARYNPATDA